jgi:hypothetical protein
LLVGAHQQVKTVVPGVGIADLFQQLFVFQAVGA